jgi:hypothetical protein
MMADRKIYTPPIEKYNKQIFVKMEDDGTHGDNLLLNSAWNIWKHSNNTTDWTIGSYEKIFKIDSIGSFWRFFNNFNLLDKITYQFYIMREGIMPIWEDVNNKHGGICSIKVDYFNNKNRNELGSELMVCICLLVLNETLIANNVNINGVSYAVKNKSILIKIWVNNFTNNKNLVELLPITFLKRIDSLIKYIEKPGFRPNTVSLQYKKILLDSNNETNQ